MDRMLVAVFDTETSAFAATKALHALDADGTISIYALAVIVKDGAGKVSVKQSAESGPLGTAVGLLSGSLIGLIAGPVGFAIAVGAGALGGIVYDLAKIGVDEDFLNEAGQALTPGKSAVVFEAWEEWVTPVDASVEELGGVVFRRVRGEVLDAQIARDAETIKAEYASLKAEYASAAQALRGRLEAKIETAKAKLRATQELAHSELEAAKQESEAKVKTLRAKQAKVHDARKAKLEARIGEVQAEYKRRSDKLLQAWELTKQALAV
jgi:uncharacterized membrane protein